MNASHRLQPWPPTHRAPLGPSLLVALALTATQTSWAAPAIDPETSRILIEAVTAAAEIDLYHARCRGDISGRRTDNLNGLLVSKLRITVLTVKDDLFPEHSYRASEQRLERDFLATLRMADGCQGAKASGLPSQLSDRYEKALGAIQRLP